MSKKLAKAFNCPTEFTLAVLGGKWKTVILCYLKLRPFRYGELRVLHPNLSDKMLSERLQDLIDVGLVVRRKSTGGKKIATYSLTDRGRSLHPLLGELYGWGETQAAAFGVKVGAPLARLGAKS
jgi:DNA-binding HxlR family transcriptional regulator